jgi:hypothetical protein
MVTRATITNMTFTIFESRAAADAIAAKNAAEDASSEYRVVERKDGRYIVTVHGEDGKFISCFGAKGDLV